ncbi:MAG: KEOPS complex subunit Pcc1 [Thermoplasmata archaeon]
MIFTSLKIESSDPEILYRVLNIENERDIPKARIDVNIINKNIIINIETENISSMRAAINSYMRWINLIEDILGLIKDG